MDLGKAFDPTFSVEQTLTKSDLVSSEIFPIFTLHYTMLLSGFGMREGDGPFLAAKFLAAAALGALLEARVFLFDDSEAECSF